MNKWTPEGVKLPFLSSKIILNSVASKNWAQEFSWEQRGELSTAASLVPIMKDHCWIPISALRHKITTSLCPLKSCFLMRFSNTKASSVCSKKQWDLILYSSNWSARSSSAHGSFYSSCWGRLFFRNNVTRILPKRRMWGWWKRVGLGEEKLPWARVVDVPL